MGITCRRGKSQRRLFSLVLLSIAGVISLKLLVYSNIALPSLKVTSLNLDLASESLRKNRALSLESSKTVIRGHGPSAEDHLGNTKGVKVSENRFHYKSRKTEELPPPDTETVKSVVKNMTVLDRLPAAKAPLLQVEKPALPLQAKKPALPSQAEKPALPFQAEKPALPLQVKKPVLPLQAEKPLPPSHVEKFAPKVPDQMKADQKLGYSSLRLPLPKKSPQKKTLRHFPILPQRSITPRRYAKDRKAYERYRRYLAEQEPMLPEQENAVIIITNHRSGSTFFSELFNQHSDAFSLFEPLFPLSNRSECNKNLGLKIELLKDFIRCRFPNWNEVYKGIPSIDRIKINNQNLRLCLATQLCFRAHTKELCGDRHCPRTNGTSVKDCMHDCGRLNLPLVQNECRRKKIVATKLIRFCSILDLESVVEDSQSNIKVLHLLRDPRGIANSRHTIEKKLNLTESLARTCERQSQNLLTAASEIPQWLEGKYMAVRYEDTALFPYETAQSVYDFVGLDFPIAMKDWIANNTAIPIPTGATTIDNKAESFVGETRSKVPERRKRVDPYSTKRNATATVQKWAKHLPYLTVTKIESVCSDMMKMAGYIKVGSYEQYRNSSRMFFEDHIPIFDKHSRI